MLQFVNRHVVQEVVQGMNNKFEFRPTDSGQVLKQLNKLNSISYQVGLFLNVLNLFRHISQLFLIAV